MNKQLKQVVLREGRPTVMLTVTICNTKISKWPWTPSLDNVIPTKSTILIRNSHNSHKQVAPTLSYLQICSIPLGDPKMVSLILAFTISVISRIDTDLD